jgi:hypothetical protein
MPISELLSLSSCLSIGEAQSLRNLTVVPILDVTRSATGWLTLDHAMERGLAEVTEVSEGGSVPQLGFVNRGDAPVFLLDGEELVGAKQNRILNLSLLVPGNTGLEIPVSCVEQGRWAWRSRQFHHSERVIYSKLRRRNSEAVSESLFSHRSARGDQGQVWDDIAMKSERMAVHSDTSAAGALYESYAGDVEEFVAGVKVLPGQVGAAFFLNDRFAGLDLLGGPDLLASLLPRIVRSYALDALEQAEPDAEHCATSGDGKIGAGEREGVIRGSVGRAGNLAEHRSKAAGIGENVRFRDASIVGAGLIASGAVAHLSLWASDYH